MRILSLPSAEDPQSVALTRDLQQLTTSTRSFYGQLKVRIHTLEQGNANLRALIPAGQSICNLSMDDVQVRATQVSALIERFKSAIQSYAEVERDNRAKNRARMERQVKIVNPGLTNGEVMEVVRQAEEGGSNAVFSQAVRLRLDQVSCLITQTDSFLWCSSSSRQASNARTPLVVLSAKSSRELPSSLASNRL